MDAVKLKEIFNELLSVYQNLKTEVLVAEVQERTDLKSEHIIINNKSTFQRPYRRDLLNIDISKLEDDLLSMDLSRSGLYDYLPEGVFHTQTSNRSTSFSANRIKTKKEEAAARSFFSPIENEFFHQRLNIEKNERVLTNNFYSLKDDYLIDFWNLSQDMPRPYLLKLIKLLPHTFKIAGNLELTRLSLEKILKNDVSFITKYITENSIKPKPQEEHKRLGIDSVLDNAGHHLAHPYLEVTIWLKSNKEINSYVSDKGINKFLEVFYSYFLPLELDVTTKYEVKGDLGFSLDAKDCSTIGISTKI
ncbi:hypothetical protein [Olleya sp. Bg11-27]|uniref:hypothetical protein n=1 Tax=Olleya sp. Bg11-27 TaxID=2058135 RepID=UPI000C304B50|nr:hypothetical protein [Olleya sp. Bg11-27]AUC76947.1 hypothetical protein CW732_15190 [Olleya sp. Bg11-27]